MTYTCFELLRKLEMCPDGLALRSIVFRDVSPDILVEDGLAMSDGVRLYITEAGKDALEPYRVRRAVILAAGFGSRLHPITERIPKPLITVNGVRIIDTILDALLAAGISEIYIVRGHLASAFDVLLEKYPTLTLVDNPDYARANNLFSALRVKDRLQNAYVLDADLIITDPDIIRKYEYQSNYLGLWRDSDDDWVYQLEEDDVTIRVLCYGGKDCYHAFGLAYWDAEDGKRLSQDISQTALLPEAQELFWDEVPLRHCRKNYRVALRPCKEGSILEIDTLSELAAADPSYGRFLR